MVNYYVLVFDGGGARGVFTTRFLMELEKYLISNNKIQKQIQELFTIFAGTSTGSIIAASCAFGYSAQYINDVIYSNENAKKIFSQSYSTILSPLHLRPTYSEVPRYIIGKELFGEKTFENILPNKLLISSYNVTTHTPVFWNNICTTSVGGTSKNEVPKILDAMMASSAAPTIFPSYDINGDAYIDGGIVSNSPGMITLEKLLEGFTASTSTGGSGGEQTKIKMISIGTCAQRKKITQEQAQIAGGIGWLKDYDIIGLIMDSANQLSTAQLTEFAHINPDKFDFLRINFVGSCVITHELPSSGTINFNIDCVDDKNLDCLREHGFLAFQENINKINNFFS